MGYYENKNKCKNFFRNKNKFVHLEKGMLISAPDSEYNYFPYLTNPYYNDLCVNLKCIPALKKIRSINVYIIKLFWEIVFFQDLAIKDQKYINIHTLDLNFARKRFFPQLNNKQETIFNTSLGITSKYFSKSKKFLKSKSSYLFSASYIRRFLTYLRIEDLTLLIRKIS